MVALGALAACGLVLYPADPALAGRVLETKTAVDTNLCANCPPPSEGELLNPIPPPEGQIEGPCGLAFSPSGNLYISDYYHRVVDVYASSGAYQAQIPLAGVNPVFGVNSLDGVCGLAFDPGGTLYANEFHQAVITLPSEQLVDSNHATGVATDAAGNVYVDDRTYVAKYEQPFEADQPDQKIGESASHDFYGMAALEGRVYVADAADQTIKAYEPATSTSVPVETIEGPPGKGFHFLANGALAVDPTNGHVLVVDNLQPKFEDPEAAVYEFDSNGAFLGRLPEAPIDGEPTGIAVDPASGRLLVTDGNSALSNVFAYGPYTASTSTLGPSESTDPPVAGGAPGRAEASAGGPGAADRGRGGAAAYTVVQRRGVRVSFNGKLTPKALPRHGMAPVGIVIDARISASQGEVPPQLRRISIAINRNGRFASRGLPVCRLQQIQPSTTAGALAACGKALVGEGRFSANVRLPQQSPFPSAGKVLAFNGRVHSQPAILAHIYGTQPIPTSIVLPFLIGGARGTYGTTLSASLPQATGNWGYVTGLRMSLRRRFSYRGRSRSYLSAGCPAPAGFPGAAFPLARTRFAFAGKLTLVSVLNRSCKATG